MLKHHCNDCKINLGINNGTITGALATKNCSKANREVGRRHVRSGPAATPNKFKGRSIYLLIGIEETLADREVLTSQRTSEGVWEEICRK